MIIHMIQNVNCAKECKKTESVCLFQTLSLATTVKFFGVSEEMFCVSKEMFYLFLSVFFT